MIPLGAFCGIEYGIAETNDIGALAQVLGESFSRHEPPTVALGHSASQVENLVTAFGAKASDDGVSVIARSTATQQVIGALLVEDFASPPPVGLDRLTPVFAPVLTLLDQLEKSYRKTRSIKPGCYLHLFMIGVLDDWTGKGIAQEMVRMCLIHGAAKGFHTAFAEATGTTSRHLFSKLGFAEVAFLNYKTFEFEGQHPFASIKGHDGCAFMERAVVNAT